MDWQTFNLPTIGAYGWVAGAKNFGQSLSTQLSKPPPP
jgi:hypothetical protein